MKNLFFFAKAMAFAKFLLVSFADIKLAIHFKKTQTQYTLFFLILIFASCANDSIDMYVDLNNSKSNLFYEENLKKILNEKCASCHNGQNVELKSYDAYESFMFSIDKIMARINVDSDLKMPPTGLPSLEEDEKMLFHKFHETLTIENADLEIAVAEKPDLVIKWTAYKHIDFDERVAVSGSFDNIAVERNEYNENVLDILADAKVTIFTGSVNIDGQEGMRSRNVKNHFFSYFAPAAIAKVISYDEKKAYINLAMNNFEQKIAFDITVEDTYLILNGSITDMNDYGWLAAYNQLELFCGKYHENKVWPDIDIEVRINLEK